MGLALSNDGKPVPSQASNACGLIPKGAKNVEVAKDFLKYSIQPKVNNELLKDGLGRNIPCMPSIVKDDPWWFADPHREAMSSRACSARPCRSSGSTTRPIAQVQNEHVLEHGLDRHHAGRDDAAGGAEKAFKRKTWDAFYDFFKEVQKKLRGQGVRNVYGIGLNVTTNGGDPNNVFNYFLIAYGGQDIVTKDGKLHLDDPKVREAAIKALTYPATAYKEGFVPPGAINWNDADDNNAFHAKQIVMDLDGTISTEVAVLSQGKKEDYDDIVTMGLALSNDGKPVPSQAAPVCGLIPKGAKNVAVAKEFLKFLIQPKVCNEYLKTGLARRVPAMPSIVKGDPWWLDPADPHRVAYVNQALLGPTVPQFWVFNPAYAQVQNEHVWSIGWVDIMKDGMAPQAAAEKAFKRIEEIFAKYPIGQG